MNLALRVAHPIYPSTCCIAILQVKSKLASIYLSLHEKKKVANIISSSFCGKEIRSHHLKVYTDQIR